LNLLVKPCLTIKPDLRKRNKRVGLLGRLAGGSASPADPSPPLGMHGQHGALMDLAPGKLLVACHLASAPLVDRCPKGDAPPGRTLDVQRTERPVSRDSAQKFV
jgi:hypothetical protein